MSPEGGLELDSRKQSARTISEPGLFREQVQGTLVPTQELERELGGSPGFPGSAGYEAGGAR